MTEKDFDEYLESIGGLVNGWREGEPPILKSRFWIGVGDGWLPLVHDLIEDLIKLGWDKQICQVKEKFGGLRFYINGAIPAIHERIAKAEHDSYSICEACGQPGKPRAGSWTKTLCDFHESVDKEERAKLHV